MFSLLDLGGYSVLHWTYRRAEQGHINGSDFSLSRLSVLNLHKPVQSISSNGMESSEKSNIMFLLTVSCVSNTLPSVSLEPITTNSNKGFFWKDVAACGEVRGEEARERRGALRGIRSTTPSWPAFKSYWSFRVVRRQDRVGLESQVWRRALPSVISKRLQASMCEENISSWVFGRVRELWTRYAMF